MFKKKELIESSNEDVEQVLMKDFDQIFTNIESIQNMLEKYGGKDIIVFNQTKELYTKTSELLSRIRKRKNLSRDDQETIEEIAIKLNNLKTNIYSN